MFTEIVCHRKIIIIIITIIIITIIITIIIIIIVVVVVVSMTFHSGIAYKPLLGSDVRPTRILLHPGKNSLITSCTLQATCTFHIHKLR